MNIAHVSIIMRMNFTLKEVNAGKSNKKKKVLGGVTLSLQGINGSYPFFRG